MASDETSAAPRGLSACHCVGLRRASRLVSHFYDGRLAPSGLRATQYAILALIAESDALAIGAMAARLGMDRTTMGQNLRPLERDGLLTLMPAPDDKRSRIVTLTDRGRSTLAVAVPLWREAQRAFEALNDPGRAAALRAHLGALAFGPAA